MDNSTHGGYTEIQELANNLILEGYDVQQLIVKLMQFFIDTKDVRVKDIQKARISEIIAEADFSMIQGGDEELNLLNVLSSIAKSISGKWGISDQWRRILAELGLKIRRFKVKNSRNNDEIYQ